MPLFSCVQSQLSHQLCLSFPFFYILVRYTMPKANSGTSRPIVRSSWGVLILKTSTSTPFPASHASHATFLRQGGTWGASLLPRPSETKTPLLARFPRARILTRGKCSTILIIRISFLRRPTTRMVAAKPKNSRMPSWRRKCKINVGWQRRSRI